jgi:hypothetical protein
VFGDGDVGEFSEKEDEDVGWLRYVDGSEGGSRGSWFTGKPSWPIKCAIPIR